MWDDQIKIVDQTQRKALIRKATYRVLETLPGAPLVCYQVFTGVRPEVRNYVAGISDFVGNTLDEIWLAK